MGIRIYYFLGNHDMWMKNYLKEYVGIYKIFATPQTFTYNDKKFLIAHGDDLGNVGFLQKMMKNSYLPKLSKYLLLFYSS